MQRERVAVNHEDRQPEDLAKIIASDWVDYLHLAKWRGRWVIVSVSGELKPAPAPPATPTNTKN